MSPALISDIARRQRAALDAPCNSDRVADALVETCMRWRNREFALRRETVASLAEAGGFSIDMLDESLDALLRPFRGGAFHALLPKLRPRHELFGFIMPGNVPGAGLHELCQAMLGGAAAIVKTSSAEPWFYPAFARTLREVDAQVGSLVAALNWSREQTEMSVALKEACDYVVAFGDDETLANLASPRLIGFGSRASGGLVACDCDFKAVAAAMALDVVRFEQRGCLSPSHLFVEDPDGGLAGGFARELALALERLAASAASPSRLSLRDAAAIRSTRENARWRRLGGAEVEMWEGAALSWTVICDRAAGFCIAPGYRTVHVSAVRDLADLRRRLTTAAGRLEAFAVADSGGRLEPIREYLRSIGVSHLCAPGEMQSPPLDWRHGNGALFDLFAAR